jgi:hypothetical protein
MSLAQALFCFCTAAEAVLLVRLLILRLHPRYPFFALYLAVDIVTVQEPLWFTTLAPQYLTVWSWAEPVLDVLLLLAAWEACRLVLANYPGAGRFGERLLFWIANAAALVGLISLLPDLAASLKWLDPVHYVAALVKRGLSTVALLALLTVAGCTVWLPTPMPRNLRTHLRLLAAYLTVGAGTASAMSLDMLSTEAASDLMLALSGLLFLAWTALLRRSGEGVERPVATPADFAESEALQNQLDRLASTLKRPLN